MSDNPKTKLEDESMRETCSYGLMLQGGLAVAALLFVAGCTEVVEWREEVAVSTKETIWIDRKAYFEQGARSSDPLKMAWLPAGQRLVFDWKGNHYSFAHNRFANVVGVYATPLTSEIAVIASTGSFCAKPGYASSDGKEIGGRFSLMFPLRYWVFRAISWRGK